MKKNSLEIAGISFINSSKNRWKELIHICFEVKHLNQHVWYAKRLANGSHLTCFPLCLCSNLANDAWAYQTTISLMVVTWIVITSWPQKCTFFIRNNQLKYNKMWPLMNPNNQYSEGHTNLIMGGHYF